MKRYVFEEMDGHKFRIMTQDEIKMMGLDEEGLNQSQTCIRCGIRYNYYLKNGKPTCKKGK